MMATIPSLRGWSIILLGAAVALFFGVAATPAWAHCKGKHTGNHEHCTGGDPPPAAFNPEIVWEGGWKSIVIANGDGSNATQILSGGGGGTIGAVSWSPGGKEILITRGEGNQGPGGVYRLPIFDGERDNGGQFSVGTPTLVVSSDAFMGGEARWSPVPAPDGNYWIAYLAGGEAFLINPDGGETIPLTTTTELEGVLAWSPNATRIAVNTDPTGGAGGVVDIVVYSLETGGPGQPSLVVSDSVSLLLNNPAITENSSAAILADDSAFIFSLDWANIGDRIVVDALFPDLLWIVPVPDVEPEDLQLAVASGTVIMMEDQNIGRFWPSWSPDDTAFIYRRSGWGEILGVDNKCSLSGDLKGKNKGIENHLVIGVLDNPDILNVPDGEDNPDQIDCDDEIVVFDTWGNGPEWWRGTFPQPPLPLPTP